MNIAAIFECLDDIGSLGSEDKKSLLCVQKCVSRSREVITNLEGDTKLEVQGAAVTSYLEFSAQFSESFKSHIVEDDRLSCAINALYLLHIIHSRQKKLPSNSGIKPEESCIPAQDAASLGRHLQNVPEANPDMRSILQKKAIEKSVRYILYTSVLSCLDSESSMYMKMKMAKEKLVFGGNLLQIPLDCQHELLKFSLSYLLPIFKDCTVGEHLQSNLLGEFLCPLFLLSFSPNVMKEYPEDVSCYRAELEDIFQNFEKSDILRCIILQRSFFTSSTERSWLKSCCSSLFIRRFLFQEKGVALVIRTTLSVCGTDDWRKKEAVATVISQCKFSNEIEFYGKIGPQIVDLLQEEKNGDIMQVLGFLVCQLNKRSKKLTFIHIWQPLTQPLISLTEDKPLCATENSGIAECVTVLYRLYVEAMSPSPELGFFLEPVLCPLLRVASLPPTCYVKTTATHVIVRYLSQLDKAETVASLFVLSDLEVASSIRPVNPQITLTPGVNMVSVQLSSEASHPGWIETDEERAKCILCILEKLKNPPVVMEFFKKLTHHLDFSILNRISIPDNLLLTRVDEKEIKERKVRKLTFVINLLTLISEHEQLTAELFSDLYSVVPFLENLLNIGQQHCEDEELAQTRESLLMNSVMLISCYVSERSLLKKMTYSDWQGLKSLLPALDNLKRGCSNPALMEFIEQLNTVVQTHGVALYHKAESKTREMDCAALGEGTESSGITAPSGSASLEYDEAMEDILSPHIPIRGHALLTFIKLIGSRNEKALKNKNKLLSLFEHHLRHEDTYIYLIAVQGLAALADAYPDKIVSILTSEVSKGKGTVETRLKMVEVLTEVTKRLGPLLPKYKNMFINTLLNGTRDGDEYIRASCLSNLGEVCKELRFAVGSIVNEIFCAIHHIVKYDKSPMVRRAAILAVTLLLQGLGKDALKVLQNVMLDIYRELKSLIMTESDSVLILQAELAMEEINTATKEFLFPNIELKKKIYVTEIPP